MRGCVTVSTGVSIVRAAYLGGLTGKVEMVKADRRWKLSIARTACRNARVRSASGVEGHEILRGDSSPRNRWQARVSDTGVIFGLHAVGVFVSDVVAQADTRANACMGANTSPCLI